MRLLRLLPFSLAAGLFALGACVGDEPANDANDGGGVDGSSGDGSSDGAVVSESGGCPGAQVSCGGACVDPASFDDDAKNCGACGHDCLGGTCSAKSCNAVTVLTATGSSAATSAVGAIASDGTSLVYVAPVGAPDNGVSNSIFTCTTPTCAAPTLLYNAAAISDVMTVSAYPGLVYYASPGNDRVYRIFSDGGADADVFPTTTCTTISDKSCIVSDPGQPFKIANDGTHGYVGIDFAANASGGGGRFNLPNGGGDLAFGMNGGTNEGIVAVAIDPDDATHKYMYGLTPSAVVAYDATQSSPTLPVFLYTGGSPPAGGIAVTGNEVFFSTATGITGMATCTSTGCPAPDVTQTLATTAGATVVTADHDFVYWAAGSSVYRCAPTGCPSDPPPPIASTSHTISAIGNDAKSLYWGDDHGGLYRLAK